MRTLTALIGTLGVAIPSFAATPAGLDRIAAYAGTWKTEVQHLDTPYGKAGHEVHSLRNDCWRASRYYACEQFLDGDSKALVVFTYDAKSDTYTSYPLPADGGAAGSGKLLIKDDVWTFPWTDSDKGKTVYFHVLNTWSSPDSVEFRQEYSTDNQHWTLMAQGRETRVK
jgi:hypothetical protein